jgi:WD40 repeat protein
MSTRTIACQACASPVEISDPEPAGKVFRCPQCGKSLRVSAAGRKSAPSSTAAPKPADRPARPKSSPVRRGGTAAPTPAAGRTEAPAASADAFAFDDRTESPRRPAARKPRRRGVSPALIGGLIGGVFLLLLAAGIAALAFTGFFSTRQPLAQGPGTPTPSPSADPTAPPQPPDTQKSGPADTAPAHNPAPPSPARELLVGKWESQDEKEKGSLEFQKDGSVHMAMAGAPETKGTYKFLDENTIQLALPVPNGESVSQKLKVQVGSDELVTTDESNKVDRFKRSTGATARAPDSPPKGEGDKTPAAPAGDVPAGWREYTSKEGGFRLRVPLGTDPREATEKVTKPAGEMTIHVTRFDAVNGNSAVVAVYGDYLPATTKAGADAVLDADKTAILLLPQGAEIGKKDKVTAGGHPGRDLDLKLPSGLPNRTRVLLAGNRMVQVTVMGELAKDPAGKDLLAVFDSLQLTAAAAAPAEPAPAPKPAPDTGAKPKPLRTFKGHTGTVGDVAVSSDGKTLASGGSDKTVRMWDPAGGKERLVLKGHTAAVRRVAFSPDGKLLASGTGGFDDKGKLAPGEVKLWEVAGGKLKTNLKGTGGPVNALAFSPDGKLLAAASSARDAEDTTRGEIKLWEVATGKERAVLKQPIGGEVVGLAFTPDGKTIVAASRRKGLHLWDVDKGMPMGGFINLERTVHCLALAPDGKTAAVGLGDRDEEKNTPCPGEVLLWDLAAGKERTRLGPQAGSVMCVAFAPDGKAVASGSVDDGEGGGTLRGETHVWDAATGQDRGTLLGDVSGVLGVAFTPDGKELVTAHRDEVLRWWDVSRLAGQKGEK